MAYSGTGQYSVGDPLYAGLTANGTLTITSGSYAASAGFVGQSAGVIGTMTLTGPATDVTIGGGATDGQFYVGYSGAGTLNISNGADFSSYSYGTYSNPDGVPNNGDEVFSGGYRNLSVAHTSGSVGVVNVSGTGSTLTAGGPGTQVTIGRAGTGTLNITSGALVDAGFVEAGRQSGSVGTISVSGPGSRLLSEDSAFLGRFSGEAGFVRLGRESGSLGYMTIDNGGVVDVRNIDGVNDGPAFDLGRNDGAYGRLDIDGAGSELNITQYGAKGDDYSFGTLLRIGRNGTGVVEATTDAEINVTGDGAGIFVSQATSGGEAVVDPTSQLLIYSGADVTVNGGAMPSAVYGGNHGRVDVGIGTNGRGEVVVDGAGSTLTVEGYGGGITLGRDGQGEMTVSGGAVTTITNHAAYYDPTPGDPNNNDGFVRGGYETFVLGRNAGSVGTATISGAGSSVAVFGGSQTIAVGRDGTGTLNVSNGGSLSGLWIDAARRGVGDTVVDGAGSMISLTSSNGQFLDPDFAGIGAQARWGRDSGSDGSLTITNGGVVQLQNVDGVTDGAFAQFGRSDGSRGDLLVDGLGSALNVTQHGLAGDNYGFGAEVEIGRAGQSAAIVRNNGQINVLGDNAFLGVVGSLSSSTPDDVVDGRSSLNIIAGADVVVDSQTGDNARFSVASNLNSRGDATVSGNGSTLTVRGTYQGGDVGRNGDGTFTISNGGYALFDNGLVGNDIFYNGVDGYGFFSNGYNNLTLGRFETGTGTVTVTGTGSQLTATGYSNRITVGRDGNATLDVLDGARVDALQVDVGRSGRANGNSNTGTLNIDNASVYLGALGDTFGFTDYRGYAGFARFGRQENEGNGFLNITNGGNLTVTNVDGTTDGPVFRLAQQDGSLANATVNGIGSSVDVIQVGAIGDDASYGARANIGDNGTGTATFQNGAQFNVLGDDATLTVSRALDRFFAAENVVDPDSVLNITSGADAVVNSQTFDGAELTIADGANGRGVINVTGTGSTLSLSGLSTELNVGKAGQGALNITGGGAFNNISVGAVGYVGRMAGSYGVINVDGATSSFYMSGDLNLGGNGVGQGILLVQNGATAEADTFNVGYDSGIGGAGTGNIDGNVVLNYGGALAPGDTGPYSPAVGTLAITGNLTATNANLLFDISGTAPAQSDTVTATGTANLSTVEFELNTSGFTPSVGDQATLLSAAGGLTFNAAGASFYGGGTQAFSLAAIGNDLIATALNAGSGAAILDFGTAGPGAANATIVGTSGSGAGGVYGAGVAFTNVTEVRGTDLADNFNAIGASADLTLVGRGGADILFGGIGADILDGGAGADIMGGGLGDDTYIVDDLGDVFGELAGQGTDTVISDVSINLGAHIENVTLTGTADNGIQGNDLDNILTGNSGNNGMAGGAGVDTLIGLDGADTLDGQAGADTLIGGLGVDTYFVDNVGDVVTEDLNGFQFDTIWTTVSYTLPDNVEILILNGGPLDINGTGNDGPTGTVSNLMLGNIGVNTLVTFGGNDVILGLDGADTISAGGGNDLIAGGLGADILTGGAGNDLFVFTAINEAADLVTDFTTAGEIDLLDLRVMFGGAAGASSADAIANGFLSVTQSGLDTVVQADLDGGGDNFTFLALLQNTTAAATENLILV